MIINQAFDGVNQISQFYKKNIKDLLLRVTFDHSSYRFLRIIILLCKLGYVRSIILLYNPLLNKLGTIKPDGKRDLLSLESLIDLLGGLSANDLGDFLIYVVIKFCIFHDSSPRLKYYINI